MQKTKQTLSFEDEDKELIEAFETDLSKGLLISELTDQGRSDIEESARLTMNPPKAQITTRLAKQDLARLKVRALELGMPYQTLLASIVHQYVEGRLVERPRD